MLLETFTDKFEYHKLPKEEMEARGILGRLVGIIADTKNPTRNGRAYSNKLWENVFNDPIMKEKIANRVCFGELGHPTDRTETDIKKVAICLAEVPKRGADGKLYGVFDILNTECGQLLKTLCDYGCNIGISSRGEGDLVTDYDGSESVDPETYSCECFDAVLIPAVKEARMQYVTESLDKKKYNKTLREALQKSLDAASDINRKAMEETLNDIGIDLIKDTNSTDKLNEDISAINNSESSDIESIKDSEEQTNSDNQIDSKEQVIDEMAEYRPQWNIKQGTGEFIYGADVHQPIDTGKIVARAANKKAAYDYLAEHKDQILHLDYDHFVDAAYDSTEPVLVRIINISQLEPYFNPKFPFNYPVYIDGKIAKEFYKAKDLALIETAINEGHLVLVQPRTFRNGKFPKLAEAIKEDISDESLNIKEEKVTAVENNEAIVEELQKSLKVNAELEQKLVELQEKLSVCYAKETKTEEEILKYKENIQKLAESSKSANALQAKVSMLESKLEETKNTEVKLTERLTEARERIIATASKSKALKENMSVKNDQVLKLNESITELKESLKVAESKVESMQMKLDESLATAKQMELKVAQLESEKQTLKESADKKAAELETKISKLNENLNEKKIEYSQKIEKSNKLTEKYKKATAIAVDKYIGLQAVKLGSSVDEIKSRLPESYSFSDIDKVCESLQVYNLSMSKLPFNTIGKKPMTENIKIKGVSSKNEAILPVNGFDDDIDADLMYLAGK